MEFHGLRAGDNSSPERAGYDAAYTKQIAKINVVQTITRMAQSRERTEPRIESKRSFNSFSERITRRTRNTLKIFSNRMARTYETFKPSLNERRRMSCSNKDTITRAASKKCQPASRPEKNRKRCTINRNNNSAE